MSKPKKKAPVKEAPKKPTPPQAKKAEQKPIAPSKNLMDNKYYNYYM